MFLSGANTGSIALLHLYWDIADIEPAFGAYAILDDFWALPASGPMALAGRDLFRLANVGLPGPFADAPGFGIRAQAAVPGCRPTSCAK